MLPRPLLLALCVSLPGCFAHPQSVDAGRYAVTFEAGRVNGSPVEVDRFEAGGVSYTLEHSVFVYEVDDPFQSAQAIGYVRRADGHPFVLRPDDMRAAAAEWNKVFAKAMPIGANTRCSTPVNERTFSLDGASWDCETRSRDATLSMRTRFLADGTGLFVQWVSWTGERGEDWSESFWASLDVTVPVRAPEPTDAVVDPHVFVGPLTAAAGRTRPL